MYNFVSSPAGTTHHKKSELEALLTVEKRKVTMLQHQLRGLADENQAFDEATVQLKHDLAEKTSALTRLEYESAQVESSDILKDSAFRDLQRKQHSLQATLENVQKDAAFERKQKGILVGVLRLWLSLEQEKRVLKAQATALHETMTPDIGIVFADDSAVLGKIPSTSALARAGLKRGDRLLSVNGHAISTAEEFLTLAVDFKVGSTLDLHALRKKTNNSMGGSNMYSKPFQSGGGGNTGDVNGDAFQVLVQAKGYPIEAQQLISQVSQTENSNNLEVWCAEIKREGETWMQDAVKTAQPWESFAKQGISL
jgi:hypothetical protein